MPAQETEQEQSLSERRAAFEAERKRQIHADRQARAVMARELILEMSDNAPYSIDDFIFAASLGWPETEQPASELLHKAAEVGPGDMVGIVMEGRLATVGMAYSSPLAMRIDVGDPRQTDRGQYNRKLEAHLKLHSAHTSHRPQRPDMDPRIDATTKSEEYMILWSLGGEPEAWNDRSTFYVHADQLLHGPAEILEYIATAEDPHAVKVAAPQFGFIAEAAFRGAFEDTSHIQLGEQ